MEGRGTPRRDPSSAWMGGAWEAGQMRFPRGCNTQNLKGKRDLAEDVGKARER